MKLFHNLLALAALALATCVGTAPAHAADLSITAANVVKGADAVTESCTAGATITSGQVVYRDSADGQCKLADSNSGAASARSPRGIALHGAASGQPLQILKRGDITIGATMTAGVVYYLSDTPGGICPVADLASGEYPTIVGIAQSTTVLNVLFHESGVAL
jgi:hypothetical protein